MYTLLVETVLGLLFVFEQLNKDGNVPFTALLSCSFLVAIYLVNMCINIGD